MTCGQRNAWLVALTGLALSACVTAPAPPLADGKAMPTRPDTGAANQLLKNDFDRMADIELAENRQSLQILMRKLYKRNPQELAKSTAYFADKTADKTQDTADKRVDWLFNNEAQHRWQFKQMHNLQGTDAIYLAFKADYTGDRVLPFIVGLYTMLEKAHGHKKAFFLTDSIHPQSIYNVARNIEIAAWKLASSRNAQGALYLLSNEANQQAVNLSFEREFGKMIGRTDLFAFLLAEKSQRLISRMTQSLATAVFLPF